MPLKSAIQSFKSQCTVIVALTLSIIFNSAAIAQYKTSWSSETSKLVAKVKKNGGRLTTTTKKLAFMWSLLESNQPPTDYESVALTE